jgi:hypothetical protein
MPEIFGKYAQWHSDKTAKTGFVGFGSTFLWGYQDFLAEYFSVLPGEGAFIERVIFLRSALEVDCGSKRVRCPTKLLNDFSQGGGDVWYPLESGHQGHGIGVLGMSAYTTKLPKLRAQF